MSTVQQAESIVKTAGSILQPIGEKIINGQRITPEEGLLLFERAPLPFVGTLANYVREKRHGN
ncbi:MAG TPA: aminofutalosine synthase MqnE, partial [Chitinophagaceae bacterium]